MKLITLALPALAFANYVPSILDEPLNPLCIVYTVVEQPIVISTCFSSKTTACIDGYTTTVSSPTCIDTTVTASTTVSEAPIFHPTHHPATKAEEPCEYTTITTDILTTVCPSPTIITHGTHTYTITEATTFTITDCPCTYTRTKHSSEYHAASTDLTSAIGQSSFTSQEAATNTSAPTGGFSESQGAASSFAPTPPTVISSSGQVTTPPISLTSASSTRASEPSSTATGVPPCEGYPDCNPISTDGSCGNGVTCTGSLFGSCCSEYGYCGSGPLYCEGGCQPEYGTCGSDLTSSTLSLPSSTQASEPSSTATGVPPCGGYPDCNPVSTDGSCGNGVTCTGSLFGSCCSEYGYCGSGPLYCEGGCQPDYGTCGADVPPCGDTYEPGYVPGTIGNTTLISTPAPAVFTSGYYVYSFGFHGATAQGSKAYAETNPDTPAFDKLAYYQIPLDLKPAVFSCTNFGYLYHPDSGLCVTANATSSGDGPKFQNSELLLEPCGTCAGGIPDIDQLFCLNELTTTSLTREIAPPVKCIMFYGDVLPPIPFYPTIYGPGPELSVATVALGPSGTCIWLPFPSTPEPTSTTISDPTSTPVTSGPVDLATSIDQVTIPTSTQSDPLPTSTFACERNQFSFNAGTGTVVATKFFEGVGLRELAVGIPGSTTSFTTTGYDCNPLESCTQLLAIYNPNGHFELYFDLTLDRWVCVTYAYNVLDASVFSVGNVTVGRVYGFSS